MRKMIKKVIVIGLLSILPSALVTNEFIQQPQVRPKKESRNNILEESGQLLAATMKKTIQLSKLLAYIQEEVLNSSCDLINQQGKNHSTDELIAKRDTIKSVNQQMEKVVHEVMSIKQKINQI